MNEHFNEKKLDLMYLRQEIYLHIFIQKQLSAGL